MFAAFVDLDYSTASISAFSSCAAAISSCIWSDIALRSSPYNCGSSFNIFCRCNFTQFAGRGRQLGRNKVVVFIYCRRLVFLRLGMTDCILCILQRCCKYALALLHAAAFHCYIQHGGGQCVLNGAALMAAWVKGCNFQKHCGCTGPVLPVSGGDRFRTRLGSGIPHPASGADQG